ncbi:hypothetical protein BH10PSE1_BH10PSE1_08290 [soil metagenome]
MRGNGLTPCRFGGLASATAEMGDYMIKTTMAAAAALLLVGAPMAASAQTTEPVSFTLNNQTDHVLVALYISVVSTNDWEEDIFGDGVLGAGESVEVTIADDLPDCEYDLKAVFEDGDEAILGSENFCELDGGSVDVTE